MTAPLNNTRGIASIKPQESYIERGLDALRGIIGIPTNAENIATSDARAAKRAEESLYRKQQTDLPYHMHGFAPETIPKEYWLSETDSAGTDKMRVPAYRAGTKLKDTDPKTGLETISMRGKGYPTISGVSTTGADSAHSGGWGQTNKQTDPYLPMSKLYARARAMSAAQQLGIPQLAPEELAGLVLQEGGAGMGGGWSDPTSKKQQEMVRMLVANGVNNSNAEFLTLMTTKYNLATRLKKPFGELWNGTGKNWYGTSGKEYANNLKKQTAAAKHPKNKQLMDIVNMGISHGETYPYKLPIPKGTP